MSLPFAVTHSDAELRVDLLRSVTAPDGSSSVHHSEDEHPTHSTRINGWGFADTTFYVADDEKAIGLSGSRYTYSGSRFPAFLTFALETVGLSLDARVEPAESLVVPPPRLALPALATLVDEVRLHGHSAECDRRDREVGWSTTALDRLVHSHGHTVGEIAEIRAGRSPARVADVIVWPCCEGTVESLVRAAAGLTDHVCLVPFGGGTSVSQALVLPPDEARTLLVVDMKQCARLLSVDRANHTITVQAGMVGRHLEAELTAAGLRLGHEPDSYEFSTVGGWVSTRASGMKKNVYGNIEDMLIDVRLVTPVGVVSRATGAAPRISAGPDVFQAAALGSEGCLGIVTQVTLKVRDVPKATRYGSLVFPNMASGIAAMHEINRARALPASIRLVDNLQFQLGRSLKPEDGGWMTGLKELAARLYVTVWKGYDPADLCAATLVFEGESEGQVDYQEKRLLRIAARHGGIAGGEENGMRGYFLTYCIAYIRDFSLDYSFVAESFETACPWSQVGAVIDAAHATCRAACKAEGVPHEPFLCSRVTQTYDTGVCIYFYLGFATRGVADPLDTFHRIEDEARRAIMAAGGTISHHHGVGKLRSKFMRDTVSPASVSLLRGVKRAVDPNNSFGLRNLVFDVDSTPAKVSRL